MMKIFLEESSPGLEITEMGGYMSNTDNSCQLTADVKFLFPILRKQSTILNQTSPSVQSNSCGDWFEEMLAYQSFHYKYEESSIYL